MDSDLQALIIDQTWDVAPLCFGRKALPCKQVYKVKQKDDRSTERLKARLVIRGDIQKEGIDYKESFSPVVKMTIIRCLLSIAIKNNCPVSKFDASNAFSMGLSILRALNFKGFSSSLNDYLLFYKKTGSSISTVTDYMDDLLLTGDDAQELSDPNLFYFQNLK